jgi:histone H3/H4
MAGKAKKVAKGGNLVVGSKVKETIRAAGVRAAGDLVDAVSASVASTLKKAVERCKANNRGTVRPQDL